MKHPNSYINFYHDVMKKEVLRNTLFPISLMGCESTVLLHFIDNIDFLGIQFIKNNTALREHQQKNPFDPKQFDFAKL